MKRPQNQYVNGAGPLINNYFEYIGSLQASHESSLPQHIQANSSKIDSSSNMGNAFNSLNFVAADNGVYTNNNLSNVSISQGEPVNDLYNFYHSSLSWGKQNHPGPQAQNSSLGGIKTNNTHENATSLNLGKQLFESNHLDASMTNSVMGDSFSQDYKNDVFGTDYHYTELEGNNNLRTNLSSFVSKESIGFHNQLTTDFQSQAGIGFTNSELQSEIHYRDLSSTPIFFGAGPPPPTPATPFGMPDPAALKSLSKLQAQVSLPPTPTSAQNSFNTNISIPVDFLPPPALPTQEYSFETFGPTAGLLSSSLDTSSSSKTVSDSLGNTDFNPFSSNSFKADHCALSNSEPTINSKQTIHPNHEPSNRTENIEPLAAFAKKASTQVFQQSQGHFFNNLSCHNIYGSSPRTFSVPRDSTWNPNQKEPSSGSRIKRQKKQLPVRELLPLLPVQTSERPKPDTPETRPNDPNSAILDLPNGHIHKDLSSDVATQLKMKSNYQLLREGKTQELGLNFGVETSFDRRKVAHKDAERIRRKQQAEQFQSLRVALSGLSARASKIDILNLAEETVTKNDSALKAQTTQIKDILSHYCPHGIPSDFPQEIIKWLSPAGG